MTIQRIKVAIWGGIAAEIQGYSSVAGWGQTHSYYIPDAFSGGIDETNAEYAALKLAYDNGAVLTFCVNGGDELGGNDAAVAAGYPLANSDILALDPFAPPAQDSESTPLITPFHIFIPTASFTAIPTLGASYVGGEWTGLESGSFSWVEGVPTAIPAGARLFTAYHIDGANTPAVEINPAAILFAASADGASASGTYNPSIHTHTGIIDHTGAVSGWTPIATPTDRTNDYVRYYLRNMSVDNGDIDDNFTLTTPLLLDRHRLLIWRLGVKVSNSTPVVKTVAGIILPHTITAISPHVSIETNLQHSFAIDTRHGVTGGAWRDESAPTVGQDGRVGMVFTQANTGNVVTGYKFTDRLPVVGTHGANLKATIELFGV